jgi:hypothetical protein
MILLSAVRAGKIFEAVASSSVSDLDCEHQSALILQKNKELL